MALSKPSSSDTIGVFAGEGTLPHLLIHALNKEGQNCVIVTPYEQIEETTAPTLKTEIGKVRQILSWLKTHNVKKLVMAGKFKRPSLRDLKVDTKGGLWLTEFLTSAQGDDALLRFLTKKLTQEGFEIVAPHNILKALTVAPGHLTPLQPSKESLEDIQHGIHVLNTLSKLDVGQAVVVQQGYVLGIEAAEGTDQLIERCASLKLTGSPPTLIKAVKLTQDQRLDLPTIGLETLKRCQEGGFSGIAIEATTVYVLDQLKMIDYADEHHLFLYSFERISTSL